MSTEPDDGSLILGRQDLGYRLMLVLKRRASTATRSSMLNRALPPMLARLEAAKVENSTSVGPTHSSAEAQSASQTFGSGNCSTVSYGRVELLAGRPAIYCLLLSLICKQVF